MRPGAPLPGIDTRLLRDPGHLCALGFGTGLAPYAAGTCGTLVAIPIYLLMANWHWQVYLAIVVLLYGCGVWCTGRLARVLGVHDHPAIVWDEIVGFLLAMLAAPDVWWAIPLGFVLFRVLDILKPYPINAIDRQVPGGHGVMLDDLLAGVFTFIVLQTVYALTS